MARCLTIVANGGRFYLILVNGATMVAMLTLIIIASQMRVSPDDSSLGNSYEETEKALLVSIVQNYTTTIDTAPISAWHIRDSSFFNTIFITVWIGGGMLLIFATFGLITAGRKSLGGLIMHSCVLFFLLIGQIVIYVLLTYSTMKGDEKVRSSLADEIQASMYTTFRNYEGIYGTGGDSVGWSLVMLKYDCCGVYGWTLYDQVTTNDDVQRRIDGQIICCKRAFLEQYRDTSCWTGGIKSSDKDNCYDAFMDGILTSSVKNLIPLVFVGEIILLLSAVTIFLDHKYPDESKVDQDPEGKHIPEKKYAERPFPEKQLVPP